MRLSQSPGFVRRLRKISEKKEGKEERETKQQQQPTHPWQLRRWWMAQISLWSVAAAADQTGSCCCGLSVKGVAAVIWEREREREREREQWWCYGRERWKRTAVLVRQRGRYSIASGYLGPLPNVLWEEKGVGWASPLPFLFPFPLFSLQSNAYQYTILLYS